MDQWEPFIEYAHFARSKPSFDAEERDPALALAETLGSMVAAAGDGSWPALAQRAARQARFTDFQMPGRMRWFMEWARSDGDSLARALADLGDPGDGADPVQRFEAFARAALAASAQHSAGKPRKTERLALATGSMLNFALRPLEVPFVRPDYFDRVRGLLGYDGGAAGSLAERYRSHLELAADVRSRLERSGLEVRDMLDVQGLILSAGRHADFWKKENTGGPPASGRSGSRQDVASGRSGSRQDVASGRSGSRRDGHAYLAVCAIYRDEAPYLREWLEFHRMIGVERFFLYDNRSIDDHRRVLAPYVEAGTAVVHDWHPYLGQIAAYEHCVRAHGTDARWIAFVDVDEFLFSPTGKPVSRLLTDYEDFPAVVANWSLFGTSGHEEKPPGPVIESYVDRLEHPEAHWYKSIVDPQRVTSCAVHEFDFESGSAVDENKYPVADGWTKSVTAEVLRLNHYVTKSAAEHRLRRARVSATGIRHKVKLERWDGVPTARDEAILVYAEPLRRALGG